MQLANGEPVIAAGHIDLYRGQVKYIDNASGHYQPTGAHLENVINDAFGKIGLDTKGKYINKTWEEGKGWKPVK